MAIELTDRAAQEIKTLLSEQEKADSALRIWVAGGGCSGLQYGMAIDDAPVEENDQVFDSKGVKVVVDALSLSYMDGAEVDFVEDVLGGGFKVENPNATGGCGCGSSFSTEEGGDAASSGGCGSCGCGSG